MWSLSLTPVDDLMERRSQFAFFALILAQAAHSVEEYAFGLYEVFAPARFVSAILSRDLATGFIIANLALLLFGLWCYIARVRTGHRSAQAWVWLWILVECGNGVGHPVMALVRGRYFPGVFTAPILLALSIYLAVRMWRSGSELEAAA